MVRQLQSRFPALLSDKTQAVGSLKREPANNLNTLVSGFTALRISVGLVPVGITSDQATLDKQLKQLSVGLAPVGSDENSSLPSGTSPTGSKRLQIILGSCHLSAPTGASPTEAKLETCGLGH